MKQSKINNMRLLNSLFALFIYDDKYYFKYFYQNTCTNYILIIVIIDIDLLFVCLVQIVFLHIGKIMNRPLLFASTRQY